MVQSNSTTVQGYLAEMASPRREEMEGLLEVVRGNIPPGFVEAMAYGMVAYQVPLEVSGPTYNGQPLAAVAVASQKQYISIYLTAVYASPKHAAEFARRWAASGKPLNMGKSCVRFKTLADADLDTIAWAVGLYEPAGFATMYERARQGVVQS